MQVGNWIETSRVLPGNIVVREKGKVINHQTSGYLGGTIVHWLMQISESPTTHNIVLIDKKQSYNKQMLYTLITGTHLTPDEFSFAFKHKLLTT